MPEFSRQDPADDQPPAWSDCCKLFSLDPVPDQPSPPDMFWAILDGAHARRPPLCARIKNAFSSFAMPSFDQRNARRLNAAVCPAGHLRLNERSRGRGETAAARTPNCSRSAPPFATSHDPIAAFIVLHIGSYFITIPAASKPGQRRVDWTKLILALVIQHGRKNSGLLPDAMRQLLQNVSGRCSL